MRSCSRIKLGSSVVIRWVDSMSLENKWLTREDLERDLKNTESDLGCESMGYLVYNGEKCVGIASSITGEDFHGCILIPKCSIIKIKKVSTD